MKIVIELNTENSTFGYKLHLELAQLLAQAAKQVEGQVERGEIGGAELLDAHGKVVGTVERVS